VQRVRIGLTGLAIVFLFVLLAAAAFTLLGHGPLARPEATPAGNVAAAAEVPKEPLAELGLTPGNAPGEPANTAAPAASPAPARAPAR
jgi:hypothetical protein